jgi:hypothetical protein
MELNGGMRGDGLPRSPELRFFERRANAQKEMA